jgi:threonine/homoserine/homoserine lactone efflux protein
MEGQLSGAGTWIGTAVLTILGLVGLFISANAQDATFYVIGLLIAGFTVLMLFRLITLTDADDEGAH